MACLFLTKRRCFLRHRLSKRHLNYIPRIKLRRRKIHARSQGRIARNNCIRAELEHLPPSDVEGHRFAVLLQLALEMLLWQFRRPEWHFDELLWLFTMRVLRKLLLLTLVLGEEGG